MAEVEGVDKHSEQHVGGPGDHAAIGHDRHCFVVMPSGREPSEQKWFRGWYEVVIKPAIREAGYEPVLAAAEEQPGAINDEIRTHLAVDPMVVVDLGGAEPEDDPNPNVMYELGIRHALGLPLVMLAWKGQRLPFDVGNQRVIMEDRDLVDLELNRKKLVSFVRAAEQGKYYRPMEAVSRLATIQAASESLAEDSLLRALAQEVRDLRLSVTSAAHDRRQRREFATPNVRTVKRLIRGKVYRKELYPYFLSIGGDSKAWTRFLRMTVPAEKLGELQNWGTDEWKAFAAEQLGDLLLPPTATSALEREDGDGGFDAELLEKIRALLPAQPWPAAAHRAVAEQVGVPPGVVSKYISELIRRGVFLNQVDGELFPTEGAG